MATTILEYFQSRLPRSLSLSPTPRGFDEVALSVTESSEQILASVTVDGPVAVDLSQFTTTKILDKRSSASGVEYKCEIEPLWLAADLVEKAKTGRVQVRSYENGLVRVGRIGTLRERKRKFAQT